MIPKEIFFFTHGMGKHKLKLQSFEAALRDAGIAICNLVSVSSIFPARCKIISHKIGKEESEIIYPSIYLVEISKAISEYYTI